MERRSIDIQRLTRPLVNKKTGEASANPFSFGGGLRHGGLSAEALELLVPVCGFDYMGASEFEHGALPDALQKMAGGAEDLVAFSIDVKTGDLGSSIFKDEAPGVCKDTVFVLCPKDWKDEVTGRIQQFAKKEDTGYQGTRERVGLESSMRLRAKGERVSEHLGWLEINNGYAFFIDEDMWRKFSGIRFG